MARVLFSDGLPYNSATANWLNAFAVPHINSQHISHVAQKDARVTENVSSASSPPSHLSSIFEECAASDLVKSPSACV